jgi:hypothetical protein
VSVPKQQHEGRVRAIKTGNTPDRWEKHAKNAQKDKDARTGAPHAIVRCHSVRNRRTRCARRGPARAEHVFGNQQSSMGGKIARTIGIVRARFKIDESRLQMSAPG